MKKTELADEDVLLLTLDLRFMDETEDSIDIKVNYKRKVNYEHLAECSISMNIMSKDAKDFRI